MTVQGCVAVHLSFETGLVRSGHTCANLTMPFESEDQTMSTMQCTYRDHVITAEIMEHSGSPLPWAGGCRISDLHGHVTRRMPLPVSHAFLAELDQAQRASIAHGKWLVDQCLDHGRMLFDQPKAA